MKWRKSASRSCASRNDVGDNLAESAAPLIEPARRGDERAWRQLILLLYPTVIGIVRNHLPHSEQEEDIMQDVFVTVFMKLEQYKGTKPFTHWVSRIALNTCYDRLRTQKSRRVRSFTDLGIDGTDLHDQTPADDSGASVEGGRKSTLALIERLIATLSPEQQIVIRLIDLEERSVSEICELTGWGASKVKMTAMRARRKLSAVLAELENPTAPEQPNCERS